MDELTRLTDRVSGIENHTKRIADALEGIEATGGRIADALEALVKLFTPGKRPSFEEALAHVPAIPAKR